MFILIPQSDKLMHEINALLPTIFVRHTYMDKKFCPKGNLFNCLTTITWILCKIGAKNCYGNVLNNGQFPLQVWDFFLSITEARDFPNLHVHTNLWEIANFCKISNIIYIYIFFYSFSMYCHSADRISQNRVYIGTLYVHVLMYAYYIRWASSQPERALLR